MVDHLLDLIPTHVRYLQVLAVLVQVLAEEAHLTGEQTDAIDAIVLLAALHQRLHADADAEKWAVLADFADQLVEAQPADLGHAVANRADAGKHHAVGLTDDLRIRSEEHTSELQSLMRISYAVFCLTQQKTKH